MRKNINKAWRKFNIMENNLTTDDYCFLIKTSGLIRNPQQYLKVDIETKIDALKNPYYGTVASKKGFT